MLDASERQIRRLQVEVRANAARHRGWRVVRPSHLDLIRATSLTGGESLLELDLCLETTRRYDSSYNVCGGVKTNT